MAEKVVIFVDHNQVVMVALEEEAEVDQIQEVVLLLEEQEILHP